MQMIWKYLVNRVERMRPTVARTEGMRELSRREALPLQTPMGRVLEEVTV